LKRHSLDLLLEQIDRGRQQNYILHQEGNVAGHCRKSSNRIPQRSMPLIEIGISGYYCDRRDLALISGGSLCGYDVARAAGGGGSGQWPSVRTTEHDAGNDPVLRRRRDRPLKDSQWDERLLSGNPSTDSKMADAHHLDALVLRQFLTDGGLRDESLTAHGTHEWQRELFRYLQHMDGVVATAFPQIGSEDQ